MTQNLKLSLINGKAMTFNPDDYMKIRSEHRIVGKLVGVPVAYPRNMMWNSLPACFADYETKLLMELGFVEVVDKIGLRQPPSEDVKKEYDEHQVNVVAEQVNSYLESRLEVTKVNMEKILKGKRKKLNKSGEQHKEITAEDIIRDETIRLKQAMGNKSVFTQIPTEHPFRVTSTTINDFPVANPQKYKIFKDLWTKGSWITGGDSFGCDFLVYPGDPIFFHASQVVHVVTADQQFDTNFLISCARLSVSVNKKCVFAYVNEDDDAVTYQTLQWDNPKLKQLYSVSSES